MSRNQFFFTWTALCMTMQSVSPPCWNSCPLLTLGVPKTDLRLTLERPWIDLADLEWPFWPIHWSGCIVEIVEQQQFRTYYDLLWYVGTICDICWLLLTFGDLCWPLVTFGIFGTFGTMVIFGDLVTFIDLLWLFVTFCDIWWLLVNIGDHWWLLVTSSLI